MIAGKNRFRSVWPLAAAMVIFAVLVYVGQAAAQQIPEAGPGPTLKVPVTGAIDFKKEPTTPESEDWKKLHEESSKRIRQIAELKDLLAERWGLYFSPIIGAGFATTGNMNFTLGTCLLDLDTFSHRGDVDPVVVGGVRLGMWFQQGRLLGTNIPPWLGYFGVYTDFTFQRQNFRNQYLTGPNPNFLTTMSSEGTAATWTAKVAARFPVWLEDGFPWGRAFVYGGVGGGLYFASQNPTFKVVQRATGIEENIEPGSKSSVVACLSVDAGVKVFITQHVYGDVWFNYTYAQPSFSYQWTDPHNGARINVGLAPRFNNFGVRFGVGVTW